MKSILLLVLALVVAALILAFSTAQAAMVWRVPDLVAITPVPVVAVTIQENAERRAAVTQNTDTAD
ncbi:MAG TPA: hypothetical protein VLA28_03490 [Afifellaceae bacterium]|nr:hypothetical protein [Afifellaceae bacterium]